MWGNILRHLSKKTKYSIVFVFIHSIFGVTFSHLIPTRYSERKKKQNNKCVVPRDTYCKCNLWWLALDIILQNPAYRQFLLSYFVVDPIIPRNVTSVNIAELFLVLRKMFIFVHMCELLIKGDTKCKVWIM